MHGSHLIHHWSPTQAGVALSSVEVEVNAMLKADQEMIGIQQPPFANAGEEAIDHQRRQFGGEGDRVQKGVREAEALRGSSVVVAGESRGWSGED